MNYADLEVAAVTNYEEFGEYAISVYSEVGLIAREIHERYLPHPKARVSTAKRIRAEGYDLKPTHDPGHYDLVLPNAPTVSDWEKLHGLFDVTIKKIREG